MPKNYVSYAPSSIFMIFMPTVNPADVPLDDQVVVNELHVTLLMAQNTPT